MNQTLRDSQHNNSTRGKTSRSTKSAYLKKSSTSRKIVPLKLQTHHPTSPINPHAAKAAKLATVLSERRRHHSPPPLPPLSHHHHYNLRSRLTKSPDPDIKSLPNTISKFSPTSSFSKHLSSSQSNRPPRHAASSSPASAQTSARSTRSVKSTSIPASLTLKKPTPLSLSTNNKTHDRTTTAPSEVDSHTQVLSPIDDYIVIAKDESGLNYQDLYSMFQDWEIQKSLQQDRQTTVTDNSTCKTMLPSSYSSTTAVTTFPVDGTVKTTESSSDQSKLKNSTITSSSTSNISFPYSQSLQPTCSSSTTHRTRRSTSSVMFDLPIRNSLKVYKEYNADSTNANATHQSEQNSFSTSSVSLVSNTVATSSVIAHQSLVPTDTQSNGGLLNSTGMFSEEAYSGIYGPLIQPPSRFSLSSDDDDGNDDGKTFTFSRSSRARQRRRTSPPVPPVTLLAKTALSIARSTRKDTATKLFDSAVSARSCYQSKALSPVLPKKPAKRPTGGVIGTSRSRQKTSKVCVPILPSAQSAVPDRVKQLASSTKLKIQNWNDNRRHREAETKREKFKKNISKPTLVSSSTHPAHKKNKGYDSAAGTASSSSIEGSKQSSTTHTEKPTSRYELRSRRTHRTAKSRDDLNSSTSTLPSLTAETTHSTLPRYVLQDDTDDEKYDFHQRLSSMDAEDDEKLADYFHVLATPLPLKLRQNCHTPSCTDSLSNSFSEESCRQLRPLAAAAHRGAMTRRSGAERERKRRESEATVKTITCRPMKFFTNGASTATPAGLLSLGKARDKAKSTAKGTCNRVSTQSSGVRKIYKSAFDVDATGNLTSPTAGHTGYRRRHAAGKLSTHTKSKVKLHYDNSALSSPVMNRANLMRSNQSLAAFLSQFSTCYE